MRSFLVVGLLFAGCDPAERTNSGTPDAAPTEIDANACPPPANVAGADVQLAAPYDTLYRAYDLGTVPGVPNNLGGTVISAANPNTLLVAGASETGEGAIYSIGLSRNACGHIIGFTGTATLVASTPFVDANLVYEPNGALLYTEWPQYHLSQLAPGGNAPGRRTDLRTFGMPATGDSGPGGLGRVPPTLAAANELRLVTWPGGRWFHVATTPDNGFLTITGLTEMATLPNQPGGFAYVPAGSPGFTTQSIIVAEWNAGDPDRDKVAVYDADAQGDPIVATRREFFSKFPRPWGAYFEPVTGDYIFLSWGTGADRVHVVHGFVPPPPIL